LGSRVSKLALCGKSALAAGLVLAILDYRDKPGNDEKTKIGRDVPRPVSERNSETPPLAAHSALSISGTGQPWETADADLEPRGKSGV
jgi:hypothetical protein